MPKPKIYIFTYNRFDTITTPQIVEDAGLDYIVLCHDEEARAKFVEHGRVNPKKIISTNVPKGLANNRNAALDMMQDGEWAIFLVDDYKKYLELDDYDYLKMAGVVNVNIKNSTEWGRKFRTEKPFEIFYQRCLEGIEMANSFNCNLVGFAGYGNPLFRTHLWKSNVLADGRAWVVRKSQLRFDDKAQMIDDVCWTADNIKAFGTVLVNQWGLPECQRYTKGSYGSIADRLEQRKKECAYLVNKHPDIIKYAKKAGWPYGSHITIRMPRRSYA